MKTTVKENAKLFGEVSPGKLGDEKMGRTLNHVPQQTGHAIEGCARHYVLPV